jgi:uncharacterized protein YecE (DUF72 family)
VDARHKAGHDENVMAKEQDSCTRNSGTIRVGVGGWLYPPWRGVFYPKGLKQADELSFAASRLTSIEINATHYKLQSPASFRKWADSTPAGFKFSVKGPRLVTNSTVLAETGNFVQRFIGSGLNELGEKLGPVLWQLPPFKRFDAEDLGKFLDLLPRDLEGQELNHVIEARHASFATPAFVDRLRDAGIGAVYTDAETWPNIADATGAVVYARLQRGDDKLEAAYPSAALDAWSERAKQWAEGRAPEDLPLIATDQRKAAPRDVFIYFIHEGKLRAPAAAMALIERIG